MTYATLNGNHRAQQHLDGRQEQDETVRGMLDRSRVRLTRPLTRTVWNERLGWVEVR